MWSRGQRLQHGHRYSCLQASKKTNDRVDLFRSNHDDAADLGWRSSFGMRSQSHYVCLFMLFGNQERKISWLIVPHASRNSPTSKPDGSTIRSNRETHIGPGLNLPLAGQVNRQIDRSPAPQTAASLPLTMAISTGGLEQ